MQQVAAKIEGNMLYFAVSLDAERQPSKSGKSEVIATTGGAHVTVPGTNIKFTMTVYEPTRTSA